MLSNSKGFPVAAREVLDISDQMISEHSKHLSLHLFTLEERELRQELMATNGGSQRIPSARESALSAKIDAALWEFCPNGV
jgi:hypothetical protein